MSKIKTKIKQYSLGLTINNQKRDLISRAPTKAQFVLHELISQIPLFWKKNNSRLLKIKRNRRLFEHRGEIKIIREKIGFLKFI